MDSAAPVQSNKRNDTGFNYKDSIGNIVFVKWIDAHHDHISDWTTLSEIEFPDTKIESVGFLVKEDKEHIMIASTRCVSDNNVCGFFTITKRQIIEIRGLKHEG